VGFAFRTRLPVKYAGLIFAYSNIFIRKQVMKIKLFRLIPVITLIIIGIFICDCFAELKEGLVEEFYPDGALKAERIYKKGVLNGNSKTYYESGKLLSEGIYSNDALNGEMANIRYIMRTDRCFFQRNIRMEFCQAVQKSILKMGILKVQRVLLMII